MGVVIKVKTYLKKLLNPFSKNEIKYDELFNFLFRDEQNK
jgi:hypothetical protein